MTTYYIRHYDGAAQKSWIDTGVVPVSRPLTNSQFEFKDDTLYKMIRGYDDVYQEYRSFNDVLNSSYFSFVQFTEDVNVTMSVAAYDHPQEIYMMNDAAWDGVAPGSTDWSPDVFTTFRDNCITFIEANKDPAWTAASSINLIFWMNEGDSGDNNIVVFYEGNDPEAHDVIVV